MRIADTFEVMFVKIEVAVAQEEDAEGLSRFLCWPALPH
jgi:hypothetical protein